MTPEELGPGHRPTARRSLALVMPDRHPIVWPERNTYPVAIDPFLGVILPLLDGDASILELSQDVADVYGISPDQSLEAMYAALAQLDKLGVFDSDVIIEPAPFAMDDFLLRPGDG